MEFGLIGGKHLNLVNIELFGMDHTSYAFPRFEAEHK